ncbi:hypothetical protein ACHAWO_012168 [Cyclotella atomus]|uniref:Uncharacterized protein n=1 Tax=Cyclotella atomus TaxID=382360 RepID=A0ABD3NPM5_9STRA
MIGGRNNNNNSTRGGRGNRRGRGAGRFTTPNHYNNNNTGFGQSPFPQFQGGIPFTQHGYTFGQGGMHYGTPGHYAPFPFSHPYQNGGGYNPGFTPNANSNAISTPADEKTQSDGFVLSPSRKGTIKTVLRGTPTPPPKKTHWSNNFEILKEEEENETEETEKAEINQEGTESKKPGKAKKDSGKTKKGMEKIEKDVDELAKEIEGGKSKKKKEKEVNAFNQSVNRLSKPTSQQSKVYLQLREKISQSIKIKMSDLDEITSEVHQTSVLVAMVTQKHAEYAASRSNEPFDTDRAHDRIKLMRKSALLKALNYPANHENLHEVLRGHAFITLPNATIDLFPHLLGSQLMEMIQQDNPKPDYIRKACEYLLKRVYISDQDRVDDFLSKLSDEEMIEKAFTKGELTKAFASMFKVNVSLPYRIDLTEFPKPRIEGWSGRPNQLPVEQLKDDDDDVLMDTPKKEGESPNPSTSVASMANEVEAKLDDPAAPPAKPEAAAASVDVQMLPNENLSTAPTASTTEAGTMDISPTPTQAKVYGKGSNRSTTIVSFRMRLQIKRQATVEWANGVDSNASFVATTFLNYYLGLAKDYGHFLEILPFNENNDLNPLTVDDNVAMLSLDTLHQYVGTLVRVNDGKWRSFEFKIKTSVPNPRNFTLIPLLSNGGQNPLVNYLDENKLTVLSGTRWAQSRSPLYLLGESDIADDPVAISQELNTRIFKVVGDVAPKAMEIEWCLVESNTFGRDHVTAPGYYVVGDLQSEDKIEYLLGKLKRDSSWPLTGQTLFLKAKACSKNNDNLNDIHETLKTQQKYSQSRIYFSVIGISTEILNRVPSDPLGLSPERPNTKTVKELLKNIRLSSSSAQIIEKIGIGDSINHLIFMGNVKNSVGLEAVSSQVIDKLRTWTNSSNGKLDLTTLIPNSEEPTFQPGMLIHTPQANQSSPKRQRLTPPHPITSPAPTTMLSNQIEKLITTINTLQSEFQLMKKELSQRPSDVTATSVITDALSSLSDKMEGMSADVKNKSEVISAIKTSSENILTELAKAKTVNDMDQAIVRAHLSGDYLIDLPSTCREDQIVLPPHGHTDDMPEGHTHPKEEEDRLNNLTPGEICEMVRAAPGFIDHNEDHFCLNCLEDATRGQLSYECSICGGVFHEECQDILEYKYDSGNILPACNRCRVIHQFEKGIRMMLKCPICTKWIESKKQEIVALSNSEKRRVRLQKLAIVREGIVSLNVLSVVEQTENALAQIYQERNQPDVDFGTNNDEAVPESRNDEPRHSEVISTPAAAMITTFPSTAASKKGATDGSAEDHHIQNVDRYKADVASRYPSNLPGNEVYDNLVHNWMDERISSIESAISIFLSDIEQGKYQMQRSDDASAGSMTGPLPHELEPLINLRDCHSLFWSTESKKSSGICPFTAVNNNWWESSGMSHLVDTCECTDGYDLDTVGMICHLQAHNHWIARVAALVVREHDVTTGLHSLREPHSSIKESNSPYQPQVLFTQPRTGVPKTEGEESENEDKQIKELFHGNRRKNQMLAGIEESSTAEKESSHDSDSDTASESKRFKTSQEVRYKGKSAMDTKRSSKRLKELRKKKDILTNVDDGESSNGSGQDIFASGDPMTDRNPEDGLLRLASHNINGSQMGHRGFEVAPDIDVTDELGIDISGLQETKKPWTAANRRLYNQQAQLKWPQGVRNIFSSAPWSYDEKDYMAGGTLLSLHGRVLGRIESTGSDKWGRFCYTTLRGSRDEGIVVINAYRTCHVKADNPGPFTSYQMEYTGLRESGIKDPQPRFQIFKDLTSIIDEKREQGYRPIVMMDANEDWVAESHKQQGNKLKRFMQQAQLADPFFLKFNKAPRTYVRGRHRLDYILVDPALLPAIRSIGYLGSMEANMSDHTMAYIDFDEKLLFKGLINRPTEIHSREFMICQDDKKLKFTTLARTQFIHHKIHERVMRLAAEFTEHGPTDTNINTYSKLDTEIIELIKCAAKKTSRKKFGYMRSPDLVQAGQLLMLYKCLLSCKLRRQPLPESCINSAKRLEADITGFEAQSLKQLRKEVYKRRRGLWAVQKECEERRAQWIQQLAEDRTRAAGEEDWEKKMNAMKKTVEDRQINRKLSAVTKGTHSQLDRIQIPTNEWYYSAKEAELYRYDNGVWEAYPRHNRYHDKYLTHHTLKVIPPDAVPVEVAKTREYIEITSFIITNEPMWRDVTDSEEIKRLLLARNKRHLQQADIEGGTSSTPIMKLVRSEHGLSTFNDQILNGNLANTIETTPEVVDWFEAIKRPPTPVIETVVGIIDKESYQDMFKNATEKTSSGGEIHYTLWKALAEQDDFAEFLCVMISLPFMYGFANPRWSNEVDVMLEKKPGVRKIHLLRIIGLLEADFNTALKYFFAKRMMTNAEQIGISDEQWGSRKNRSSIDAAMLKLLMFETARVKRATLAGTYYDLCANYDRIFKSISNLIAQRSGMDKNILRARALVIENMRRRVKTALGTSVESYGQEPNEPEVGGEVQGKGDVPSLWCVQSDTLLRAHEKGAYGMYLQNPDGSRNIKRCNTQFVDDDDGWASAPFDSEHPLSETVRRMQHDAQRWNNINNIPGQTIAFHKCKWQILAWHVINGDLKVIHSTEDVLVLKDNKGGAAVIEFLPPDQPNKGLGYYLCPDGNQEHQYKYVYDAIVDICEKITGAQLSEKETRQALLQRLLPKLDYGLYASYFNKRQSTEIDKVINASFLPRLRINRNTDRYQDSDLIGTPKEPSYTGRGYMAD